MSSPTIETLHVGGAGAARALELDAAALSAAPEADQVPDVSALVRGRRGRGLRLRALAALAGAGPEARFVHVASSDGTFTASLPLERVLDGALVLYALDGGPLPAALGGPFRLLVLEGDDCSVNVKSLGRIEFAAEPGGHTARCADGAGR